MTFTLDPRLENDTYTIAELPLCRVLLMNDARYPWAILVPRRPGITEVFALNQAEQRQFWEEGTRLGEAMMTAFKGDKLNVATLGNVVSQLHLHVVIRRQGDDSWPGPVWGQGCPLAYADGALDATREQLSALCAELTRALS
ncbi:HIT domain-containing protein [Halomonas dongshanensis]|uniref:HIT domain-containing protein n=1 Tax=Halomonas dongshanensis TaxID=2890835 RepID=A0ABT2EK66_9GAMM|nr:HIT domain-containing protein [Halomonas dongshanensis]MCS2610969.1 HIT domain-containing protein [Halomonas dongshanensis]